MAGRPWTAIPSNYWSLPAVQAAGHRAAFLTLTLLLAAGEGDHDGCIPADVLHPVALARRMMLTEEFGRRDGGAWVEEALGEAVTAGLLVEVEGGVWFGDGVWVPLTQARKRTQADRQKAYEERKKAAALGIPPPEWARRKNAGLRDPLTENRQSLTSGLTGKRQNLTAGVRTDTGPDARLTPGRQEVTDQEVEGDQGATPPPTPPARKRRGGPLSEDERAALHALRTRLGEADKPPSITDSKARSLLASARHTEFSSAVSFVRWYGQQVVERELVAVPRPWLSVSNSKGAGAVCRVLALFDESGQTWADFRVLLRDGARGLLDNDRQNGRGEDGKQFIEVAKHLCRDLDQLNRHVAAGQRKAGPARGAPYRGGRAGLAGAWDGATTEGEEAS